LEHITNADRHYDEWLRVGAALKHAGCDVSDFIAWSRQSSKHDESECVAKWESVGRSSGRVATLATLVYL
ncbi:PriCT-2 domain-containing protein, partial [Pseudomonas aeruginosa]|uniref:PriCT-2 domain-containing protein n=1 Tax=Pseudomonas aeruginosa TaxID=287 RepID=UPI00397CAFAF